MTEAVDLHVGEPSELHVFVDFPSDLTVADGLRLYAVFVAAGLDWLDEAAILRIS